MSKAMICLFDGAVTASYSFVPPGQVPRRHCPAQNYFMQAALQAADPFGAPHIPHISIFPQAALQASEPFGAPHLHIASFLLNGQLPDPQQPVMAIVAALSAMIPNMVIFFIFSPFFPFGHLFCF